MKYILGGGLSGLIFQHFHPEYTIIEKKETKIQDGPFFLWDKPENRRLCDEFSIPYHSVEKRVGYFTKSGLTNHISGEDQARYIKKSRCIPRATVFPKSLSEGKNIIQALDSLNGFHKALRDRANIISGKVSMINTKNKQLLVNNTLFTYKDLVSTLPAPVFFSLCGLFPDFQFCSKLFRFKPQWVFPDCYDILYNSCLETSWSRASRVTNGMFLEYNIPIHWSDLLSLIPNCTFMRIGQIQRNENLEQHEGVRFLGRYAQWTHGIKVHDVIKKAEEMHDGT